MKIRCRCVATTAGHLYVRTWGRVTNPARPGRRLDLHLGQALCNEDGSLSAAAVERLWGDVAVRLNERGIAGLDRDRILDSLWKKLSGKGWVAPQTLEAPHQAARRRSRECRGQLRDLDLAGLADLLAGAADR
jgi:hypothetical protein